MADNWNQLGMALGRSLFGADREDAKTRMGKELAQQAYHMSGAQLNRAKADEISQRAQYRTPEYITKMASRMSGLTDKQAEEADQYFKTNSWGKDVEQLPVDVAGPPLVAERQAPSWATPETISRYSGASAAALANLFGTGDSNAAQVADAYGKFRDQGRTDLAMQDGVRGLNAYRAADAGKLYSSAVQGVLSQETGLEAPNPEWVRVQRSVAAENAAQARNADASAALSRERIGETRAKTELARSKTGQTRVELDPISGEIVEVAASPAKPMPATALRMQNEELDMLAAAEGSQGQLSRFIDMIDSGELDLGLVENLKSRARNFVGSSNENSRNFASFQATLEKLRNDSLRLNKGVQTEGDAQRAWNELLENINDPDVVKQRLAEIIQINERASQIRQLNIDNIRRNYGHPPMDVSGYRSRTVQGGSPAQHGNLPPQEKTAILAEARAAVAAGAPRDAVIKRLRELGVNDGSL